MATEALTDEPMADGNSSNEDVADNPMTNSSMNGSMDAGMTEPMTASGMADDTTDAEMQDAMADTAMEERDQTETSNPGFGIVVAVIAILGIAALAFRRRM